ncbi:ComF family protein [Roseovarius nubinhibens]|uniref:double zinc ribbon domain-containing protein n=2 Tax=Roseovarius TaxID=74030 RepID=UPI001C0A2D4C|nr:double zinc ribbon domain-containing protein [Roseovarius nubinhibens]MBU2999257.1 ComF family protein [Roseovarius nubinhibens]
MNGGVVQSVLQTLYPPRCLGCGARVESDFGLCGPCWRETPFISGLVCDACGIPLPGEQGEPGGPGAEPAQCDACLVRVRPWARGRAVMLYESMGRRLVLGLKHGDRHDVLRPAGRWLARAGREVFARNMLIVPMPLHWTRLVKRRFNQSAHLAEALARETGLPHRPDVLIRPRATPSLGGMGHDHRFQTMAGAITLREGQRRRIAGRPVLIVDDVMTSGASLSAAAEALVTHGAAEVSILVLARAGRAT